MSSTGQNASDINNIVDAIDTVNRLTDENIASEANAREHINLQEFFEKSLDQVTALSGDGITNEQHRFAQNVVKQLITQPRKEWSPYVNGWYYVNMVSGTWVEKALSNISKLTEFSPGFDETLYNFRLNSGHLIKDIDPPEKLTEYEAISGRTKNINIATKVMPMGEFSIDWKESADLTVFKYHESWLKYIEADKKGFVPFSEDTNPFFIDIPYYNAIWITIFKPFTFEIQGLVKLLGVSPTNLPLKSVVGKRADHQLTTYSINYKVTDIIAQFYDETPQGNLYQDFINDQENFFNTERVYKANEADAGLLNRILSGNSEEVRRLRTQQASNNIIPVNNNSPVNVSPSGPNTTNSGAGFFGPPIIKGGVNDGKSVAATVADNGGQVFDKAMLKQVENYRYNDNGVLLDGYSVIDIDQRERLFNVLKNGYNTDGRMYSWEGDPLNGLPTTGKDTYGKDYVVDATGLVMKYKDKFWYRGSYQDDNWTAMGNRGQHTIMKHPALGDKNTIEYTTTSDVKFDGSFNPGTSKRDVENQFAAGRTANYYNQNKGYNPEAHKNLITLDGTANVFVDGNPDFKMDTRPQESFGFHTNLDGKTIFNDHQTFRTIGSDEVKLKDAATVLKAFGDEVIVRTSNNNVMSIKGLKSSTVKVGDELTANQVIGKADAVRIAMTTVPEELGTMAYHNIEVIDPSSGYGIKDSDKLTTQQLESLGIKEQYSSEETGTFLPIGVEKLTDIGKNPERTILINHTEFKEKDYDHSIGLEENLAKLTYKQLWKEEFGSEWTQSQDSAAWADTYKEMQQAKNQVDTEAINLKDGQTLHRDVITENGSSGNVKIGKYNGPILQMERSFLPSSDPSKSFGIRKDSSTGKEVFNKYQTFTVPGGTWSHVSTLTGGKIVDLTLPYGNKAEGDLSSVRGAESEFVVEALDGTKFYYKYHDKNDSIALTDGSTTRNVGDWMPVGSGTDTVYNYKLAVQRPDGSWVDPRTVVYDKKYLNEDGSLNYSKISSTPRSERTEVLSHSTVGTSSYTHSPYGQPDVYNYAATGGDFGAVGQWAEGLTKYGDGGDDVKLGGDYTYNWEDAATPEEAELLKYKNKQLLIREFNKTDTSGIDLSDINRASITAEEKQAIDKEVTKINRIYSSNKNNHGQVTVGAGTDLGVSTGQDIKVIDTEFTTPNNFNKDKKLPGVVNSEEYTNGFEISDKYASDKSSTVTVRDGGTVTDVRKDGSNNIVTIKSDDGTIHKYSNLDLVTAKPNQNIKKGDAIGVSKEFNVSSIDKDNKLILDKTNVDHPVIDYKLNEKTNNNIGIYTNFETGETKNLPLGQYGEVFLEIIKTSSGNESKVFNLTETKKSNNGSN